MQLNLNHLSFAYPDAALSLLTNFSVTFPAGWTGIVGENGCGKTTLARIAARLLKPDEGDITPHLFSTYCSQDATIPPHDLEDFALDWGQSAVRLRQMLAIEDEWLWRFETLSGGQQKRIQIACALWMQPDVLIMDEPTNDLDADARACVRSALASYKGIGLLISHDRELLDALASQCLMFENGVFAMRPGGYSKARAQAEAERASAAHEQRSAKKEAARLKAEAQRRSEEAARSKARLSGKHLSKSDSDGRERLGRAKVSSKDGVAGRASAALAKRLDRAQAHAGRTALSKRYDPAFGQYGEPVKRRHLLHVEAGTITQGAFTLRVPEIWVGAAEHVGISGANGAGKSVLVRHLLSCIPDDVKVAQVPQEVSEAQRQYVLDRLRRMDAAHTGEVLSLVARLNSDPDQILDGKDVSPGEMRKVILAEQLLQHPNALILDEPTNHLDIGSIEALQGLLASFSGALVLVSHDAALLESTCQTRWLITRDGAEAHLQ